MLVDPSPQKAIGVANVQHRIVCVGTPDAMLTQADASELLVVQSAEEAIGLLRDTGPVAGVGDDDTREITVDGIWVSRDFLPQISELHGILQSGAMLRDMPEGVALLDEHVCVLWANRRLISITFLGSESFSFSPS